MYYRYFFRRPSLLENLFSNHKKYPYYGLHNPANKTYRIIPQRSQLATIGDTSSGLKARPIKKQAELNNGDKPIKQNKTTTHINPPFYGPIDPSLVGIPFYLPYGPYLYRYYRQNIPIQTNIKRETQKDRVIKMHKNLLHKLENDINRGMSIDNNQDTIWKPYNSFEGGAKTIHDGLKLNDGTKQKAIIDRQGYLTNEQAKELVHDALSHHYDVAKRVFNDAEGPRQWDELSDSEQRVLTDFAYNGVIDKFPKFIQGLKYKDTNTIFKEYKRYSNGKELKIRNDETEKILQLIAIEYSNSSN